MSDRERLTRRAFVERSAGACLAAGFAGWGCSGSDDSMGDVSSGQDASSDIDVSSMDTRADTQAPPVDTTPPAPQALVLVLSEHPELAEEGGVKAFPKRDTGLRDGVLIYHAPGGEIIALDDACTHRGCAVGVVAGQEIYRCPCHSSTFDLDGALRGGPASDPLVQLESSVEEGTLTVVIP